MCRAVFAGLIALFLTALCFGQATDSNLVGTVTDASGAAVPGANLTAVNQVTGVSFTAVTNPNGDYRINNVPVGKYDITAAAKGFAKQTKAAVSLELNRTMAANFRLEVGAVTTTVEVEEAAANIDTTTAQVQNTFESRAAVDLPQAASGLGVINLWLLSAGIASSAGLGYGTGPSVGGQRPTNNNFSIEGIDNNRKDVTGQLFVVPNDVVAQFTLLQNQFSPEFGGSSGGIFTTVVKSGTNELDGSVYEYLQNRNLNVVDASTVHPGERSNPRYDQNRLGATIGGPVKKNKLFYFGDFEYIPYGASATPGQTIFAPTASGYSTIAGLPGISKTNLSVLQGYLTAAPAAIDTIQVAGKSIPVGPSPSWRPTTPTPTIRWSVWTGVSAIGTSCDRGSSTTTTRASTPRQHFRSSSRLCLRSTRCYRSPSSTTSRRRSPTSFA